MHWNYAIRYFRANLKITIIVFLVSRSCCSNGIMESQIAPRKREIRWACALILPLWPLCSPLMAQPTTVTTEYFPHQSRAQGQLASLSAVWSPAWNYRGIPVSSRRGFYRYMTNRLTANKLTLNRKKSNFVIFRPYQKRLNYLPQVNIFNNEENKNVTLEHKNCI